MGWGYPQGKWSVLWWNSYRCHTITDVCTTALLLIKPLSDEDEGFDIDLISTLTKDWLILIACQHV